MKESGFYPPGAEHDSNAPYNQPDEEYIVCPECGGYDKFCSVCDGLGSIIRTFEDDLADEETAAEEKGDRIRNEY
ncbi:unnamed protein product [marine sediment metagenome]|uniref:Uncharacterized protein n=1 Tax=marine sediment metagenome TaxID=412755 RepID=X1J552_9ZZZZ